MKIKTPVTFVNGDMIDADGQTIMQVGSRLLPAAAQAVVDAFEDAARFQFLQAAYVIGSPERQALEAAIDLDGMPDDGTSLAKAVDAARAALAAVDTKQAQA